MRKDPQKTKEYNAEWHKKNRIKVSIQHAKRYRENRERVLARTRAWAIANPEKVRNILKKHRTLHREDIRKREKELRQLNLEHHRKVDREGARRRRRENPEKYRKIYRDNNIKWESTHPGYNAKRRKVWAKNNPDKLRATKQKRRTRVAGAGGSFTEQEWKTLCAKYNQKCLRCKRRRKLTADHVVPFSKGGTSNIDNIQPLCGSCNSKKGIKIIDYR